jgi:hypothetical protein
VYEQDLVHAYPAFFSYLLSQGILIATFSLAKPRIYAWVFLLTFPITLVVYCLMVKELYNHIFSDYPGIAMFGRWSVYLAALLAVIGAVATWFGTREAVKHVPALRAALVPMVFAGQTLVFGLALLLIFLLLVISRYPLRLHKNVVWNCVLFSSLLLLEGAFALVEQLTGLRQTRNANAALMVVDAICFGVWGLMLSREGATRIIRLRRVVDPLDERRLLGQLDSFNAMVLRGWRK